MRRYFNRIYRFLSNADEKSQEFLNKKISLNRAIDFAYYSFAFIFIYFGIQKPAPAVSPPRVPIDVFLSSLGIPLRIETAVLFVGFYEILLGILFLFKNIRLVFWPFIAHQLVGFLVLLTIPYAVFQTPWLNIAGIRIPWLLDGFSAFVLKNIIFVACFLFLFKFESREKRYS